MIIVSILKFFIQWAFVIESVAAFQHCAQKGSRPEKPGGCGNLLKIFAYTRFIVVLLSNPNGKRSIFLFIAADDPVSGTRSLQGLLVMFKLPAIGFQEGIAAQATKQQCLQDPGSFHALPFYTSPRSSWRQSLLPNLRGDTRTMPLRMPMEQALCNALSSLQSDPITVK